LQRLRNEINSLRKNEISFIWKIETTMSYYFINFFCQAKLLLLFLTRQNKIY